MTHNQCVIQFKSVTFTGPRAKKLRGYHNSWPKYEAANHFDLPNVNSKAFPVTHLCLNAGKYPMGRNYFNTLMMYEHVLNMCLKYTYVAIAKTFIPYKIKEYNLENH